MLCELADSHDNTGYEKAVLPYSTNSHWPEDGWLHGAFAPQHLAPGTEALSHLQTSIELWWQEVEACHEMTAGLGLSSLGLSEINASKLSECLNNQHPFTHKTHHSTDTPNFRHNYKRRQDSTTHKSRLFFFLLTSWLPSGVL